MINVAWNDPSYPPTFIGPLKQGAIWGDPDKEHYPSIERGIFRLYRDNDLPALREYNLTNTQETYWAWRRIIHSREHQEGYSKIPYIMWAGMMFHPDLWVGIPANRKHLERFLAEEYSDAEDGLKLALLHFYLNDEDWNGSDGVFYRDELLRLAIHFWEDGSLDKNIFVEDNYVKILQAYQQNMTEHKHGQFLAWLVLQSFLAKGEDLQEGKLILKDIMLNGGRDVVAAVIPVLLRNPSRNAELLNVLQGRDDELAAPLEWLVHLL